MNGILLLNKPKNMTSHDCVNRIRKIFHTKKVGHLGTLDPNVTGVLPLCINDATKIIQFIENSKKEYIATISIGKSTNTEDSDGEVITNNLDLKSITRDQLLDILNTFLGTHSQVPPMISSIKVNGKKLYEYARKNIEVERPVRQITIYELELLSKEDIFVGKDLEFVIRVLCSKGTYIRTLAVDIGKRFDYPAHMKKLIRTKSGDFSLENCFTFEEIEKGYYKLISLYDALNNYPMIEVDQHIKEKISHGQKLENNYSFEFTTIVFCDILKNVLAVYEKDHHNDSLIKPIRVFI